MAQGPLAGMKVVEFAHVHFGPGAGMFLGDMGADVIRIESPEGDQMRRFSTLWGVEFNVEHERNTFTEDLLRNKRSIALDLSSEEAREVVYRLVEEADIFVTNFRPQATRKLALDYETLKARNPDLIYAHGTSYGPEGPERDSAGLEMMGLARGGMMLGSASPGGEPIFPTMGLNDRLGSIGLLVAILGAVVARERTGEGQLVETSLLGWMVNVQAAAVSCSANTGQDVRPLPRRELDDPSYNWYQLGDGTWIALGMIVNPSKYWPLMCEALGLSELVDDPRFADMSGRRANNRELIRILDEAFAQLTWPEWDEKIHRFDLISCRINALTDLTSDEQILANDYLVEMPHPDFGKWWYITTPVHYEKTPVSIRSAAPQVGENSVGILQELGYSDAQVDDLRAREIVWTTAREPATR